MTTPVADLETQARQFEARLSEATRSPLFGSDVTAMVRFALAATDAGRADLAIAVMARVVSVAPNAGTAWQVLALAHRAVQDTAAALTAFERARALLPGDVKVALGHALTVQAAGQPAAALFAPILRAAPTPQFRVAAAEALFADGQPSAAIRQLEQVVSAAPDWIEGYEKLATIRWLSGDRAHHTDHYARAVKARPADIALWLSWYRVVAATGNVERAATIVDRAQAVHGALPVFAAIAAHQASLTGDLDRADALFAALDDDDHSVALAHLRHCLQMGRIDAAAAIAQRWLQTPAANAFWPYQSLIWRLQGDARAAWLDGDPPLVRVVDLPISAEALALLAALLRRLHVANAQFPEQSVRGGTQTVGNLLLRLEPEIVQIRALISAAVADYIAELPPPDPTHPLCSPPMAARRSPVTFAGSWSVRLADAGHHVAHTHTHGWISSALYVALPPPDAMGTPPAGWLTLGGAPEELGIDVPPYCQIEPKPARLVLFPATMWHATYPFLSGERLTIAFDIAYPRG